MSPLFVGLMIFKGRRLIKRRGHYDLLYKSEDIFDQAMNSLRNPEVRRVYEPVYPTFSTTDFPPTDDFGAYMADFPGYTLSTPAPVFSSTPLYQSPNQPSSLQGMPSPTSRISTQLASANLVPAAAERRPHPSQSPSPSSSENTPRARFRGSPYQYEYQDIDANLRLQRARAGVMG